MRIASWNVNSIRVRIPSVLKWLEMVSPDVLLLQEIKCTQGDFPEEAFEDLGYNVALFGQKTYNGVALLSKSPLEDIQRSFPEDPDPSQARYIEAVTYGGLRIASVYVPNGQSWGCEKFSYKLAFLQGLRKHMQRTLCYGEKVVWGGDYNVAPIPLDAHSPTDPQTLLCSQEERRAFAALLNLGLTNALRSLYPETPGLYSWWDYRQGAWSQNRGFLIDHLLLSPQAADALTHAQVDTKPRGWDKASDHAPLWCGLMKTSPPL